MKAKKADGPKPVQKKAPLGQPRTEIEAKKRTQPPLAAREAKPPAGHSADRDRTSGTPRPVGKLAAKTAQPKVTLYRHTTAPKFGDPQLDKIASDISHGIAKRSGRVIVPVPALTLALRGSKNVKWRNASPIQWCEAVHSFLLRNLAHRTKLLTFKAEGSTIIFKAVWRLPT